MSAAPPVTPIETDAAPTPAGHYAQAVRSGDLVFVSGQLPRPAGTHALEAPFDVQADLALTNLIAILDAAGCGPGDILRVTAYIVGVDNWPAFNRLYARQFGAARPARTVVPVPELHHGYLVEVDAIARRPGP